MTDYQKYRGKCLELSEELCKKDPSLTLVRGYYHCPINGKEQHWWCVDSTGKIIDPSVKQFATKGIGASYEEFDGYITCDECGKKVLEEEAHIEGRYAFCSGTCFGKFVGILDDNGKMIEF